MEKSGSLQSVFGWLSLAVVVWIVAYEVSEASKEEYLKIKPQCAENGLMFKECKEIMADKKMTNFEYLIFQNELAEKEKIIAASNIGH